MSKCQLLRAFLASVLILALSEPTKAEEIWSVRGGMTTLTLDAQLFGRAGLGIERRDTDGLRAMLQTMVLDVDSTSELSFVVESGNLAAIPEGEVVHGGALIFKTTRTARLLDGPTIRPAIGSGGAASLVLEGRAAGPGLVLDRLKTAFHPASGRLRLHCPEVRISGALAEALGDASLANVVIGQLRAEWQSQWTGGDPPGPSPRGGGGPESIGPDMTFCQLYGLYQAGRLEDIVGLSLATTSWNIGNEDIMWFKAPDPEHPFIVMNLFRLKSDRFEQIGQSWVKHGFYALGNTQCGGDCTYEPDHDSGKWLGQGCTDTYSAMLNAAQNGLAPRGEVNPWTGEWTYAGSHLSLPFHSHDGIEHRIQVRDADLDPAQNPGATYFAEGYYAILDDVNVMNSASWKEVTVSGSPGGTWSFGMSGAATPPEIGFAIDAWDGATQTMMAEEVPPIEFVSPDGRCILAAKATDLGGGTWNYEYALLNIDLDRKVQSVRIPKAPWTEITNTGFHAVESHDEPYSNTAWQAVDTEFEIVWNTMDNPLRWGTLYNFRFDAGAPPDEQVAVVLGLFEPGDPTTLSGVSIGPDTAPNGNAIRGGLLWDRWWEVNGAPAPSGDHPLYPPTGQQAGSTTYRCKECHGWDYMGVDGAYGSGPHYTGIGGVYGSPMSAVEMFHLIKYDTPPTGHGFSNYGLGDDDIRDLVQFLKDQVIDTGTYIDGAGHFIGDPLGGLFNYEMGGYVSCAACHGDDGTAINFGTPGDPEWVGTIAEHNPWKMLHKTRFGEPGYPMPSWLEWGGTNQGAADLGLYCQLFFPVDCLDPSHCDDGDPCNGTESCLDGHCVASTLDGDLNADGAADGLDIRDFVIAVLEHSSDPIECAHGDFSGNGVMDLDDLPCMVATLLAS